MAHRGTEERDVVAGIFPDQEHASDAITRLIDNHFEPSEEISVLLADPKTGETREADARDDIQNYSGAKLGGGIGAALGATGAGLVGAGLIGGPVGLVAAGPVLAALQGALAGGAFGHFSGWLVGAGLLKEDADVDRLRNGAVWVGVHAKGERAELARNLLREAGATEVVDTE